jgi:hypothetical protein
LTNFTKWEVFGLPVKWTVVKFMFIGIHMSKIIVIKIIIVVVSSAEFVSLAFITVGSKTTKSFFHLKLSHWLLNIGGSTQVPICTRKCTKVLSQQYVVVFSSPVTK